MTYESTISELPVAVRASLQSMDEIQSDMFIEEFARRKKSVAGGYFSSLLFFHYGYVGRIGMTLLGWLVAFMTLGIGMAIWWIIDLFRIPGIVRNYNSDLAISILRDQRIIMGGYRN